MTGFIVLARCNFDDVICGLYETVESAFVRAKEIANDPDLRHKCQPLSSDTEMLSVCVPCVNGDNARFVREYWLDIESVLENEADNHETEDEYDIREDLIDLDELRAFIDKWNAKQVDAYTWTEDYRHKVDMRPWHKEIMEEKKE